jgi:acetyltransferase-like isoleucine patch superfamily enzyme
MNEFLAIAPDVKIGQRVTLSKFINLYGCEIGDDCKIGAFVEVQKNAKIGNRCKISSHTFICEGVIIEDSVFIGHSVIFINDTYPRATNTDGSLQTDLDWTVEPTVVKRGASVGSGTTILANVTVGENSIVGAGSVVTKDVPPNSIVAGNPARVLRSLAEPVELTHTQQLKIASELSRFISGASAEATGSPETSTHEPGTA